MGKILLDFSYHIVYINDNDNYYCFERRITKMQKYLCEPCGYIYNPEEGDPDGGIAPGTAFEDIPEDWVCPLCGLSKDAFVPVEA